MLNEIRLHGIMVNSQTSPSCAEERVTTMVTLTENPPPQYHIPCILMGFPEWISLGYI